MPQESLEKMLYVFVAKNQETIDKLYESDERMKKVCKKLEAISNPIDQYMVYDDEELRKNEREEIVYNHGLKEGIDIGYKDG